MIYLRSNLEINIKKSFQSVRTMFSKAILLISVFLLMVLIPLRAVSFLIADDSTRVKAKLLSVDTGYIGSFYDRLCITFVGVQKGLNMYIQNPDPNISSLQYRPNTAYSWGMGIDYKWFSLELTTRIKSFFDYNPKKGTTRNASLRLAYTGKKTWASIIGTYYSGFYINNPTLLDEKWFEKNNFYPYRRDISTFMLFADFKYAFNYKKYSQMAALWQLEHQKRSAGSIVTGLSLALFGSKGKWSYVPEQLWDKFPPETRYMGSTTINLSYNLGYVYTFVFKKKAFLHLGLIPGFAFQGSKVSLMDYPSAKYQDQPIFSYEGRMGLGYNGTQYYFGLTSSINEFSNFYAKGGYLSFNYTYFRIYFGRRFKMPFKVPLID